MLFDRARFVVACLSVLCARQLVGCERKIQDAGHPPTPADLAKFDAVCAAAEGLWQQWLTKSCLTPQPKNADNTWTAYVDGHGHQYIYFEDSGPQCARAHAALVAGRYWVSTHALGKCEAVLTQRLARCEVPELSACSMLYGAVAVGGTCYREEILGVNPCPDNAICGSCPGTCQAVPSSCIADAREGPGACPAELLCKGDKCVDPCCGPGKTCRVTSIDPGVNLSSCGTGEGALCGDDAQCDLGLQCVYYEAAYAACEVCDTATCPSPSGPSAEAGACDVDPLGCAAGAVCKNGRCQHASLGDACVRHKQCESGYCASGHCAQPLGAGQVCVGPLDQLDVQAACQAPLTCGFSGDIHQEEHCREPNTVGKDGACLRHDDCAVDLDCDLDSNTCQPRATENQPCPSTVGCTPGLFCSDADGGECGAGVAGCTCRKAGAVGACCGFSDSDCAAPCDSSLVCRNYICVPPAKIGTDCGDDSECVNPALPDLYCSYSRPLAGCQLKRAIGQSCGDTIDCVAGAFCNSTKVCTASLGPGESCKEEQCQEGLACTLLHDGSQRCVRRGTQEERPWCYPSGPTDK